MAADGEVLGWVRLAIDPEMLVAEVLRPGKRQRSRSKRPTAGNGAVDALQAAGPKRPSRCPSKVGVFDRRRVTISDCQLLGDLLRANMLSDEWISTPQVRKWRELVLYRAKLVGLRTGLKAKAHAVLAKLGVHVPMTDLFGVGGRRLLAHLCDTDHRFHSAFGQRIESIVALVDTFDQEIAELSTTIAHTLGDHAGYHAIQHIDEIGPITAAILVTEIGDVTRFQSAGHLASWCGLTSRHRESDTTIKRRPITK